MIVAIEGASAAGKTTWCRTQRAEICVAETPENIAAPDVFDDPAAVGRFWVEHASVNWERALAIEREHGVALCDGDPFHLYFAWALWKSAALDSRLYEVEAELYRTALRDERIGFVDRVLWIEASADELRRRAAADHNRRRKRHELYLRLVPWMKTWFAARERLWAGSVQPLDGEATPEAFTACASPHRYSLTLMDDLQNAADADEICRAYCCGSRLAGFSCS
jgi:hypothetical protein